MPLPRIEEQRVFFFPKAVHAVRKAHTLLRTYFNMTFQPALPSPLTQ